MVRKMIFSGFPNCTLPENSSKFAPENGWLEYDELSFWLFLGLFSEANWLLVSGSVVLKSGIIFPFFLIQGGPPV